MAGLDPETQVIVPIFNPRQQKQLEHFIWLDRGVIIEGTTPIGRATCIRLDLNDTRYPENDSNGRLCLSVYAWFLILFLPAPRSLLPCSLTGRFNAK